MLVNGIDISTLNGKLLNKDIQPSETTVYSDWLRKSLSPLYLGKQVRFKRIKLTILIESSDYESCLYDISKMSNQFEKCTIKFDDLEFYYDCMLSSQETARLIEPGYYIVNLELKSGYSYLPAVSTSLSGAGNHTINAIGDLPSPAIITLSPSVNISAATFTGFGKPIVVKNLQASTPIIIDGEQCLVTVNGNNNFSNVEMWDFPTLLPGENNLNISISGISVQVQYKPKFF